MNWNDPAERGRLIERVGILEYERLQKAWLKQSTIAVVNGYSIRPVSTRFGRLFLVQGTDKAFRTKSEAEEYASKAPRK